MNISLRSATLLVILTLVAGALGGWLGVVYGERVAYPQTDLDTLIHHDLHLTVEQNHKIKALEDGFAVRRNDLETEMRAANEDLAIALDADHKYGVAAQAAVDRFHRAEKQLQEATIQHVLEMRAVLDAQQSQQFDHAVHAALTAGAR